ncbi:hypothetical protein Tcan_05587 [Toxocara canis]|uniref:MAM domain-containing protein n=1 Tax=Toxocara canis TaxID=6265 RepID=A0A0B2VWY9_TOXCA|nr:hypothetical protein Tcan_05587 [Toxocara canis]
MLRHAQRLPNATARDSNAQAKGAVSQTFLVAASERLRIGPQYSSKCPLIDCTFDSGNLCEYISVLADDDADLVLGGLFVYAGEVNDPEIIFVLSTLRNVAVDEHSVLQFFVYMAGRHGRLRVCIDHIQKCPFEKLGKDVRADSRNWLNYEVSIQKGSHMVFFVADRLRRNYVIGLDQIQLLNKFDLSSAKCFS